MTNKVAQYAEYTFSTRCACGEPKRSNAQRCRACYMSGDRAWRKGHAECACGKGWEPTPWHCRCGRWKLSTEQVCETCQAQAVAA